MQSCFNGATAMPYSLQQDIESAGKAGFQALELWGAKFDQFFEHHSVADLAGMLRANKLAPAGIEVALSLYAWRRGYRVCPVHWHGVTHVMKIEKMGMLRGNLSHFKMYGEIIRYLFHTLAADRRETGLSKPRWAGGGRED